MAKRPFIQNGIDDLEKLFETKQTDPKFLKKLFEELEQRRTPRAQKLKARATTALVQSERSSTKKMNNSIESVAFKYGNTAKTLNQWFWDFGIKRKGQFEVSVPGWLYPLDTCTNEFASIHSLESNAKVCFGFWGPSQVGKSTLLARYLDASVEDENGISAIQWSSESPVTFNSGATQLNPFNAGADATGCVSRFTLAEAIPHPTYPVEFKICSRKQIFHVLASGFLSEWNLDEANGKSTNLTANLISGLLSEESTVPPMTLESLSLAIDCVNTLKLLAETNRNSSRYSGLSASDCEVLLSSKAFCSNAGFCRKVIDGLFWDSEKSISETCDELLGFREKLSLLVGGSGTNAKKVFCDYNLTRLLLDMRATSADKKRGTESVLENLTFQETDSAVLLGIGSGSKLFPSGDRLNNFQLLQALVWELVVPVNNATLKLSPQGKLLGGFLEYADLLDFPGVANIGNADGSARLNRSAIARDRQRIFSDVIKRGKTASVAISSSQEGQIQGFSVLLRTGRPIARPDQITNGIKVWWQKMTGQDLNDSTAPLLPLNLVLTFFGSLINDALANPSGIDCSGAVQELHKLGRLSDPKICHTFALRYPQWEPFGILKAGGQMEAPSASQMTGAKRNIQNAGEIGRLFERDTRALDVAFDESGMDYLIEQLGVQAKVLNLSALIKVRKDQNSEHLVKLIEQVAPDVHAGLRNQDLKSWEDGIVQKIESNLDQVGDPAKSISLLLRKFFSVSPDEISPLPQHAANIRFNFSNYVGEQLVNWRSRRSDQSDWKALGMPNAASLTRIIGYFMDDVDQKAIALWLSQNFGHLNERSKTQEVRRYIAIRLGDVLMRGIQRAPHTPLHDENTDQASCFLYVKYYGQAEETSSVNRDTSPHYRSVVFPLAVRIQQLIASTPMKRPAQSGDEQLLLIEQEHKSITGN